MPRGICGLCQQPRKLCDSHLLPEAGYNYARLRPDGSKDPRSPLFIGEGGIRRDPAQVKKYFLCSECEGLFNKGGESWFLENCFRHEGRFPLEKLVRGGLNRVRFPRGWIVYADDFPKLRWQRLASP
jgi:hypothetical protein